MWYRQHNQPAHSEVALDGQQCTRKTTMDQEYLLPCGKSGTPSILELHTPSTLINSLQYKAIASQLSFSKTVHTVSIQLSMFYQSDK